MDLIIKQMNKRIVIDILSHEMFVIQFVVLGIIFLGIMIFRVKISDFDHQYGKSMTK